MRILAWRMMRELAFTPRGLGWLPTFSVLLSVLVYLFLTNRDLSLMDQKTMIFMTAQAIVMLGVFAVVVVSADAVAGERDRGTLEALLTAPITRTQLLGGTLVGALSPWAAMVVVAMPYLAVISAGTGGFLLAASYLIVTGTVLALGVAAWTLGISARADSLRNGLLVALIAYAGLAVPAVLSSTLRGNWVGRAYDFVDPFSNVMNTLDSVIIDEQGLALQGVRLVMLAVFAIAGLAYARRELGRLSLA